MSKALTISKFLACLVIGCTVAACSTNAENRSLDESLKVDLPQLAQRPELTTQQCQEQGGSVIGDIGDGRIHRPEFTCPSGNKPIASIVYSDNEPISTEGAVCCI